MSGLETRRWDGEAQPLPISMKVLLAALLVSSLAVKLFVFWWQPNTSYTDVLMQYLEQAHRVLTGQGLVPWEYALGLRSYLVAGLIIPGMKVAALLGGGPEAQIFGAAVVSSLFSLALVVPAFLWGWRFGGPVGAALCGALGAFWFENVYYAGHPMQDAFGTYCLVPGIYLAYPNGPSKNLWRLFAAGLLLGLATAFRMQIGPVAVVAALWVCRLDLRRYLAIGAGGILGLGVLAPLDWATWGAPFHSIFQYVKYVHSAFGGANEKWGYSPWYIYPAWLVGFYSGAFPLLLLTGLMGARRLPLLLALFLANLLVIEMVAMKHPRYMYPGVPLVLTLCGIGMAEMALRLWEGRVRTGLVAAGGIAFVVVMSGLLAAFSHFSSHWVLGRGTILATRMVNKDPAACGLAIAPPGSWWLSGGYVSTDPRIPLYAVDPANPEAKAESSAYNYVLATTETPQDPLPDLASLGFSKIDCLSNGSRGPACLWHRAGGCTGSVPPLKAQLHLDAWLKNP